jgi:hypothetical protein
LVRLIPAWSPNATSRAIATPKLIFIDSGLASHLVTGITNDSTVGDLVETFVTGELACRLTWSATMARMHHYRDRDGYNAASGTVSTPASSFTAATSTSPSATTSAVLPSAHSGPHPQIQSTAPDRSAARLLNASRMWPVVHQHKKEVRG